MLLVEIPGKPRKPADFQVFFSLWLCKNEARKDFFCLASLFAGLLEIVVPLGLLKMVVLGGEDNMVERSARVFLEGTARKPRTSRHKRAPVLKKKRSFPDAVLAKALSPLGAGQLRTEAYLLGTLP